MKQKRLQAKTEAKSNRKTGLKKYKVAALIILLIIAGIVWIKTSRSYSIPTATQSAKTQVYQRKAEAKRQYTSSSSTPPQGSDYTIPSLGMKLVYVAPGSFQMGYDGDNDELVHRVTISKGYWIGKYEVTQSEYQSIMGTNPSRFKGFNKPVENVSWNEAVKFCEKLSASERAAGRLASNSEYRLPTESEWEFAARGGTKSRGYKYSGSDNINNVAWYTSNTMYEPHEVGTKSGNELGIHDMSGNVYEWCNDWYYDYSGNSVTDPTGASSGSTRVIRGGCYIFIYWFCHPGIRYWLQPSNCLDYLGFRLVRTVPNNER